VTAKARQLTIADGLQCLRSRLGELPGDTADLHHRNTERVGQHHRHLQDDAQLLANVDRRELLEALGAIAGLQQKGVARRDLAERCLQRTGFASEDQWGIGRDLLQRAIKIALIGPIWLLLGVERMPRGGTPCFRHAERLAARLRQRQ